MFVTLHPLTRFREKLTEQLPDSLDRVKFSLILVCMVLSFLKMIIAAPVHFQSEVLKYFVAFSTIACFILCFFLILRPKHLPVIAKLCLIAITIYLVVVALFSKDQLTIMGIQNMFIVIMMAFYCLNRFWGLALSFILFGVTIFFLIGVDEGYFSAVLIPPSYSFEIALTVILINFFLITYIHFVYNRTLIKAVTDSRALNVKLNKLVSAKSEFLSTMSHELRTPLNSLLGIAYLLADGTEENKSKNLETLRYSAENLLAMINDILDYSKMSSEDAHLNMAPFSLTEVVEQVVRGLQDRVDKKGLRLSLTIQKELRQKRFMGDPTRLTQILYNLVGNAIKFTPEGLVAVEVTLTRNDEESGEVYFRISDSGIGIEPSQLEYVFEPFAQVPNEINRELGGTGLGLALVKNLVNLHHGTLSIESQPDKGTTCHLRIPYQMMTEHVSQSKGPEREEELIHKRDYGHLRVLLAEDNPMSVIFMKQLLSKWGITPVLAADGEEVLQMIQEHEVFDVILMDIRMPKLTGEEATKIIREHEKESGKSVYIIALTASVSGHTMDQWEDLGFDDYLSKPFWPNDLLDKIEQSFKDR